MKICVITTVHPPDDVRINKELKTLVKTGYEVHYIAPKGNFTLEGVIYHPTNRYSERLKRVLKGGKEAFKKALEVNADIYHFHDPELLHLGLKLKTKGKKVIYDIHEDYPSVVMMKKWIPKNFRPLIAKVVDFYERRAVKVFDGIVVVVEKQLERFKKVERFCVLPNYPEEGFLSRIKRSRENGYIRFIYTGSIDEDRAIEEMIEAFRSIKTKGFSAEFRMIGPIYSKELKNLIDKAKLEIEGFVYIGRIPYIDALQHVANSDVGMLVIHRGRSKENSSPLKMFEYMAFGLPIIASDFEYWKKTLGRKESCALYVDPEDPKDIANKMEQLIKSKDLRENLSKIAKERSKYYTWESIENKLIDFYRVISK